MTSYLTAKLVGEGFARPDAHNELPIDVQYSKLSEWLVDRKQVPGDWNRKLQAIQAKAAAALRELPPGFLSQLEGVSEDTPLNYFKAQRVLAKLSETAEKSLLGSLKGPAGEWDKVVRAYEYNLIYVAEAAQTLCRNADFEIPFLKKQAAKCQQQLADLEKRKAEAVKSAAAAAAEFQQECAALGISSGDIWGGLLGLTADLPSLAAAAVEALQAEGVSEGIQYYSSVVGSQGQQEQEGELLPVLAEVREGRTEAPAAAAAAAEAEASLSGSARPVDSSNSAATGLQLDWDLGAALEAVGGDEAGSGVAAGPAVAGISWDLDASDLTAGTDGEAAGGGEGGSGEAASGISWQVEMEPTDAGAELAGAELAGAEDGEAPQEIAWDIDMSGEGEEAAQREQQQGAGSGDVSTAPAAADEPATIRRLIEDAGYRARLLDDLYELRAFLMQRCRELSGRSSELLIAAGGEGGVHISADQATGMVGAVDEALAQFGGDKLKQLMALRTSRRYLDRMAAGLQQKAAQEAKFHRAAADAEARRGGIQRQLMADAAKLAALVKHTRQAKEEVERALSAKLGRRINVMGEVNQLLM